MSRTKFRYSIGNVDSVQVVPIHGRLDAENGLRLYVDDMIGDPLDTQLFVRTLRENADEDIDVEINSIGGSVVAATQMFNAMSDHRGTVTAYITGEASSAAMTVACAADKVVAYENSTVFVHPANVSVLWAAEPELQMAIEMVQKATIQTIDMLTARSGQEREVIESLVNAKSGMGTTLTAAEAQEYGLVDEVKPIPRKSATRPNVIEQAKRAAALAMAKAACVG